MRVDPQSRQSIEKWLRTEDESALQQLWRQADEVRARNVGDAVHLRGLVEISNYCVRSCSYCGLNTSNLNLPRYRMKTEEIVECALKARDFGYGTVVLQAGEDYGLTREWVADVARRIKGETNLAVTLSLGERPLDDLRTWKQAGANRYLLRFETSDRKLYEKIHPSPLHQKRDRMEMLQELFQLGYEVGSGVMIGIPGQTYASLAEDIDTFRAMDLDMIGVGPFIPHPHTILGSANGDTIGEQVPNTELMTYKVIALCRLVRPDANIPSTTALATLNKKEGRELGLQRGANVVMPNLTPPQYRVCYEIYPDKACLNETAEGSNQQLIRQLSAIGRTTGRGPGGRR